MARPSSAPRRYAEAAFDIARRDDALDAWDRDLRAAAELFADERVERAVDNPAVALAEREAAASALLEGRVGDGVKRLVALLVRRGRAASVGAVAREFQRLLNRERGIVTAVVTSAAPLTDDELAAVRSRVESMTNAHVDLRTAVDPSLIGGLTVQVGDRLYDASVRGRLERLRAQLVGGSRQALGGSAGVGHP